MSGRTWLCAMAATGALLGSMPSVARAEPFADVFAGTSFTDRQTVEARTVTGSRTRFHDVDFDPSGTIGGRFGYWMDPVPFLGFAVDAYHFLPDIDGQEVRATTLAGGSRLTRIEDVDLTTYAFGFDVMLRVPLLTSPDFPKGRLQPYVGFGPALFVTFAKDHGTFGVPHARRDEDVALGAEGMVGVTWLFKPNIGMFFEGRLTHFNPQLHFGTGTGRTTVDTDVDTVHALAGVTFRF